MRILLTNDDGINAPGLVSLEKIARELSDDVWIVAPESDQSGVAHSLTLSHPLRLRHVKDKHYSVNGTPTDCVIMAVREVLDTPPDLILSGVNSGQNIADDVIYSGTVAGAVEGALLGIKSIALSQAYDFEQSVREVKWHTCEHWGAKIIKQFLDIDFPAKTLVNVNIPNCEPDEVKQTCITSQGSFNHGLYLEKRSDGRGFPYYWIKFGRETADVNSSDDISALKENAISITPLKLDMTDPTFGEALSKEFSSR